LLPAFKAMKESGARHVHYKVCSTFDSSPKVGSIGKAIDCGATVFPQHFVPVLGGMPALGRYCLFGNLFARMGIGSNGAIYRLDRHPSMSRHPVTPAHESDLLLHLAAQTKKQLGLINITDIEKDVQCWQKTIQQGDEVVLLDVLNEAQLTKIGHWLDASVKNNEPLFSVGSSGIEMALGNYWNAAGMLHSQTTWPPLKKAVPLLVVSGSCSPVTAAQISYAIAHGFEEVVLDAKQASAGALTIHATVEKLIQCLQQQKSVVLHTGIKNDENLSSDKLGTALGIIAKEAVEKTGIRRVVIAGGDTSSYAARAMEIESLEMKAPFFSGAPVCSVHSKNIRLQGLELNLKGGQVGGETYFIKAANGG
ncbi:MAG TPA: four-carbon acid sugar kinase family protein, partial [Flavisolibacter sp.]